MSVNSPTDKELMEMMHETERRNQEELDEVSLLMGWENQQFRYPEFFEDPKDRCTRCFQLIAECKCGMYNNL